MSKQAKSAEQVVNMLLEDDDFEKANQMVHPVEKQWHYPILTALGFVPETPTGIGFVRSYAYKHPNGISVRAVTGANSDYWEGSDGSFGYWRDLQPWATKVTTTP